MEWETVGTVLLSLAVSWGAMREQVKELRRQVDGLEREREARTALELQLTSALERWSAIDKRLGRIEDAIVRVVAPRTRRDDPPR